MNTYGILNAGAAPAFGFCPFCDNARFCMRKSEGKGENINLGVTWKVNRKIKHKHTHD